MKKLLSFCMALFLLGTIFAAFPVSAAENYNVVFLGGSITAANPGYASMTGKWFKDRFPDKNVNIINAGLGGTTSEIGLFRLRRDVISTSPDVVFVEFAVNDTDLSGSLSQKYMDGIVWELLNLEKVPAIIFVYTTKQDGTKFTSAKAQHEQIAHYYGIPSIDMGAALEAKVASGTKASELLTDGVHPNITGHTIYADTVKAALDKEPEKYLKPLTKPSRPKEGSNSTLVRPDAIPITGSRVTRSGAWTETAYSEGSTVSQTFTALKSNTAGDSLTVDFYGSYLGFGYIMNEKLGDFTYSIDGGNEKSFSTNYSINYEKAVGAMAETGLSNGWHKLVIKVNSVSGIKLLELLVDEGEQGLQKEDAANIVSSIQTMDGTDVTEKATVPAGTTAFQIIFAYPMSASIASSIEVRQGSNLLPATVTVSDYVATVRLNAPLGNNTKNQITVTTGAKTKNGTALSSNRTVSFASNKTTAPKHNNLPAGQTVTVYGTVTDTFTKLIAVLDNGTGKMLRTGIKDVNVAAGKTDRAGVTLSLPENVDGCTVHLYGYQDGKPLTELDFDIQLNP